MPVPFRKRKRQTRGRVSKRKAENLASLAPEAAESEDEEASSNGLTKAESEDRSKSPGEYGPL
jgi:hypothetical protein